MGSEMTRTLKRWIWAGSLAGLGAGTFALWKNRALFLVNDVTTGESAAYPHLLSRVYYAEPDAALEAARQAVRGLERWHVVLVDSDNDALEAEAETLVGGFVDDVTVYAVALGHGQTRVIIRSRSRVGRGDLGQNAQHIRELQGAMDARLTKDAAF